MPSTAPLPTLRTRMANERALGLSFMWAAQTRPQLTSIFGEHEARTLLGLTNNLILFGGSKDAVSYTHLDVYKRQATTPDALKALRADGIHVVMLTGDNQVTAHAVAATLGIEQVEAEVLPDHKSDIVTKLRSQGHVVAMALSLIHI